MKSKLVIGLLGENFEWGGGLEFLRYVANGLLARRDLNNLAIYLLLPVESNLRDWKDVVRIAKRSFAESVRERRIILSTLRPLYLACMSDYFPNTLGGGIEIVYYQKSRAELLRCLQRIGAAVALPAHGSLGRDFPIPWVGYIGDFQHKYLADNFEARECFDRDIAFATTLRDSTAVVVNSRAVKEDIFKYYPYVKSKIFNLPFSPNAMTEWFGPYAEDVRIKYKLPSKYFLVSNQFWIHKDHRTAFKAMGKLVESKDIILVCTGTMGDYRMPEYMNKLTSMVADMKLSNRILFLGHIPKRDQIEIMKQSIAIIQPTLFEGGPGGGCVYDAVSLGVPVILSDIPVNREVESENLWFFQAGDSQDLVEKMRLVMRTQTQRPTREALLNKSQSNLEQLGDRLLETVRCVLGSVSLTRKTPRSV